VYKIIGADGHAYGPATAGQLRQWMAEGCGRAIAGLIFSVASLFLGFGPAWLNLALHPENLEWHFKWS
jgi:hypothetical protein